MFELNRTQVHRSHQSLTKTQSLSIFHANIRSLRNQLNYIIDIVEDFNIIFFREAHLDNSISDADISLPGFEVPIRRDRNCSGVKSLKHIILQFSSRALFSIKSKYCQ
jgi:hypothetical protein